MYLVGIDISKFKHDCFIATETGQTIKNNFSFANDFGGFSELLRVLKSLDHSSEIRIGLEATGHYGSNLKIFLHDNGYPFMELNPLLSERYRQVSSLRKTKTDKIDAMMISKLLLVLDFKPYPLKSYHILALKSLVRFRWRLIEARTKHKVRLQNIMDLTFPEYFKLFAAPFGETSLFILSHYPTAEKLARADLNALSDNVRRLSHGRFTDSKLYRLVELAKSTIGNCNEIFEMQMAATLDQIKLHDEQIHQIEVKIMDIMDKYHFPTASIRGIGVISAASIISEYGDFSLFCSPAQMLSFAGLEPAIYQSGTQTFSGKMVKRGSPYLRLTLMNVSNSIIHFNPVFHQYYQKKRNEGKPHRVALSHVAKKLIRVIFKLEKDKIPFDLNQLK